jgi:hypothetical protein
MKLYQQLAQTFTALVNCRNSDTLSSWEDTHLERIEALCAEHLPSGSGYDSGTTFDDVTSKPEKLVFNTAFHHMDEHGGYDGWTHHTVILTPSLVHGFNLRITGKDRNMIKTYMEDTFSAAFNSEL